MIELGLAFVVFVLFSLGVDYMMWHHFTSIYEAQFALTNKLLEIDRQAFLLGNHKAFLLNQACCSLCKDCTGNRFDCKDKRNSRPSPEGFAVDVYKTIRNCGMEINVVSKNPSEMTRIAILLIN